MVLGMTIWTKKLQIFWSVGSTIGALYHVMDLKRSEILISALFTNPTSGFGQRHLQKKTAFSPVQRSANLILYASPSFV